MRPVCPFDGAKLEQRTDKKGYTMFVCPQCDARFHADTFVEKQAAPQIVPVPYPVYPRPWVEPSPWRWPYRQYEIWCSDSSSSTFTPTSIIATT